MSAQEPARPWWTHLYGRQAANVVILVLCLIGFHFFVLRGMRFFLVPSSSMENTLLPNDHLVTLREREYRRGDIVVFRDSEGNMVKRVVGVGGDLISVKGGALFVNDIYASEPYLKEPMEYGINEPVQVPPGKVFLLGDNRNESDDSHTRLESFSLDDAVGRAVFIYYPYDRWRVIRPYPLVDPKRD